MQKASDRPPLPWPLVIAVLIVADVTATFETQMILAALKALYADLRSPAAVAWLVTTYQLVAAVAAPILGRLGDLFGRKRVVVAAIVIAAAGSLLSAVHPDPAWIIAGRAMQGVAGAVLPLCYGIVREAVPPQRQPLCGGLLICATSFGAIAGLVVGGLVVDHYDWRSLFWLSALMGVAVAVLAALLLPTSKMAAGKVTAGGARRLDIVGGLLFAAGAGGLLLLITAIGTRGLRDPLILGEGAAVVVLLVAWVWHELRQADPLIDVRLLGRKEIALTNLAFALVALGPFQLTLLMMLLLQQSPATGIGLGLTAAVAGALKIPGNIASLVSAPIAGQLGARIGERWVILFGFVTNLAAWLALFVGYANFWAILGVIIVSSIGTTVAFVGTSNQIARVAPPGRVSEALGMNTALRSMAHACGSQIMTMLLGAAALTSAAGGGGDPRANYFRAFAFITAVCLAGIAATLALPKRSDIPAHD